MTIVTTTPAGVAMEGVATGTDAMGAEETAACGRGPVVRPRSVSSRNLDLASAGRTGLA